MKHRDIQPGLPGTRAAALVCAAFVLLATRDAGSTTLLKLSVEQMSEEAALIVHGHVAWNYTTRNEAEGPIYTYTGFEVETCVAGECPDAVTLKHRGGTVGDLTLYIPGMPRFADGQEALLFLRPDPEGEEGRWAVFGMVQGFFHVVTEPASGEKLA